MQNKHKIWLLVGVIIIALVGVAGFNNSQTPLVKITDPNSTDSNKDPLTSTINTLTGKNTGTQNIQTSQNPQNPQQTTPQTTMKPCPTCKATGEITCPKCDGAVECWKCRTCKSIWPRTKSGTCMNCYNKGIFPTIIDFYDCSCGNGKVTCPKCGGTKQVHA